MVFEMHVESNTPLIGEEDAEIVARKFFVQIGYISKGADPDIPFKIFVDFFLKHQTKPWLMLFRYHAFETKPTHILDHSLVSHNKLVFLIQKNQFAWYPTEGKGFLAEVKYVYCGYIYPLNFLLY